MSYVLGVDLGTTFTAAAICRREAGDWGKVEVLPLGSRAAAVSSVLFFGLNAAVLFGDAAERRALAAPDGVAREFKRRIGDRTPLLLAGEPHTAHELAARLARWVVDRAIEREGSAPEQVAITHPAGWGEHKKSLLVDALSEVGLGDARLLSEPEAAAFDYSSAERVEPGSVIAVYDLGGGTFDAAVVRKVDDTRFELLGEPTGVDRLGGVDFDEAVFEHLRATVAKGLDDLAPDDPVAMSAAARLRRECTEAKEALSTDTEVTIPVLLPSGHTQARMVRGEFEAMIRPALDETVELLRATIRSAGVAESELDAVLLVGGSSRIPLVSQLLSQQLGRAVAVDSDPKSTVARGAARAVVPVVQRVAPAQQPPDEPSSPPARPEIADIPLVVSPPSTARRRVLRPRVLVGAAGLAVSGIVAMGIHTVSDVASTSSDLAPATQVAAEQPAPMPPAQVPVDEQKSPAVGQLPPPSPTTQATNRRAKPEPNTPDAGLPTTDTSAAAPRSTSTPTTDTKPSLRQSPPTTQAPPSTTQNPPPQSENPPPTTQDPPPTTQDPPPTTQDPPPTTEDPPPTTQNPPPTTEDPPPTTQDPPPTT
ncbi:Hsp70 family protein [Umezawaea tangerina]|uniref:Hsp70 protein n=1 Tax=Umezawaea tangerina TaxID=84725 RepID=A0A2T0T7R7_9PSEU|nr:Hsp70 family protein [Umezawaea tangerina]PRY41702.1 Hsp70 protein [Umezawaea tangerina]